MRKSKNLCIKDGWNNPIWSRRSRRFKGHQVNKSKEKSKVKKVVQKTKQVSSKRARQSQAYSVLRKLFLSGKTCEFPKCNKVHKESDTELTVHHKYGRNGERLLDTRYWMVVCMEHHQYIEEHREESYERNWLIKRNSKLWKKKQYTALVG